jgi:hypothetical protein
MREGGGRRKEVQNPQHTGIFISVINFFPAGSDHVEVEVHGEVPGKRAGHVSFKGN